MIGIILAGGLGTRLRPLTNTRNKHTLLVAGRPMIEYPTSMLVGEGITTIAICLNGPFGHQVEEVVGSGEHLGCKVRYFYEEGLVGGPGRSLAEARNWEAIRGQAIAVLFGDGVFFSPLHLKHKPAPHMYLMDLPPGGADGPEKYAQAKVDGEKVLALVEKPPTLVSTLVQAGAFIFPPDVFGVVEELVRKTGPGTEIGITEINSWYASQERLTYTLLPPGSYIDCGTPEALCEAAARLG